MASINHGLNHGCPDFSWKIGLTSYGFYWLSRIMPYVDGVAALYTPACEWRKRLEAVATVGEEGKWL